MPQAVSKLLIDAGKCCMAYHDQFVRRVKGSKVQVDEIWTFTTPSKRASSPTRRTVLATWTWTALDADTKLIVSYRRIDSFTRLTG